MVTQPAYRRRHPKLRRAAVTVHAAKGHDWYYTVDGQTWRLYNISNDNDPLWHCSMWDGNWFVMRYDLTARTRQQVIYKIGEDMEYDAIYNPRQPHEYDGWLSK